MTRRVIVPAIAGVLGVAILLALGIWQVQRLQWKAGLIAEIETRVAAEPVALPGSPDPARDRLLRVTAEGRLAEGELNVISSLRPWGPGYRIVTPLVLEDGRRILADLGFVPQEMKDGADRPGGASTGHAVQVTGFLLWPAETDGFTPEPDLERNIWFARDVDAMAAALDTQPLLIVAESHSLGEWPRPMPPGTDLPNRHLEYAITWFGLALVWAVMTVLLIRHERAARRPSR